MCHLKTKEGTTPQSAPVKIQTVTNSYTAILIDSGYLLTCNGIFRMAQVTLGIVCIALIIGGSVGKDYARNARHLGREYIFITTIATTYSSFTLLRRLFVLSKLSITKKAMRELIHCGIFFTCHLYVGIRSIIGASEIFVQEERYELLLTAGILSLLNAFLSLLNAVIIAQRLSLLLYTVL